MEESKLAEEAKEEANEEAKEEMKEDLRNQIEEDEAAANERLIAQLMQQDLNEQQ